MTCQTKANCSLNVPSLQDEGSHWVCLCNLKCYSWTTAGLVLLFLLAFWVGWTCWRSRVALVVSKPVVCWQNHFFPRDSSTKQQLLGSSDLFVLLRFVPPQCNQPILGCHHWWSSGPLMQTLQLSKPVVSIEPQARKTCTADRSKTKILGSKFKTFLKPPHLHHTCNIWQHVCFVRKSVRTFSSNVEHAGPGALITVAARKLPVSSAVFLPSPFWPNVEPSPPRPNLANGMQMGKLAKPMQPLSNKMWQLWHCSRHLIFRPWRSRPPPFPSVSWFSRVQVAQIPDRKRWFKETVATANAKPSIAKAFARSLLFSALLACWAYMARSGACMKLNWKT